jgi:hypothetical protein
MPPGAIVCVDCGYNQDLGRKMETQVESVGTPPTGVVSRRRLGKAARKRRALGLVATGLNLLFWGVLVNSAAVVLAFVWALGTAHGEFDPVGPFVCGLVLFVGSLLHIAGRILCLNVPRESQAKAVIVTAVILELIAMLTDVASAVFELPEILEIVGPFLHLPAIVVFLLFLKQLARYVKNSDLAHDAQLLINGGLALLVLGPGIALTCVGAPFVVGVAIYLLIRYVRLLRGLYYEVLYASDA